MVNPFAGFANAKRIKGLIFEETLPAGCLLLFASV